MKEYLFVYGQFRDTAKSLLSNPIHCGRSSIDGKIYKVNDFYPGFVDGDGKIIGDVYIVEPETFKTLDEFEGDEYIRAKVTTDSGLECWVYKYILDVAKFEEIKGGDWWLR